MYDTIKLKATSDQRIRVDWVKRNIKKGEVIEARKSEVLFFRAYGFMELKMLDKKPTEKKKETKDIIKDKKTKVETKKVETK